MRGERVRLRFGAVTRAGGRGEQRTERQMPRRHMSMMPQFLTCRGKGANGTSRSSADGAHGPGYRLNMPDRLDEEPVYAGHVVFLDEDQYASFFTTDGAKADEAVRILGAALGFDRV